MLASVMGNINYENELSCSLCKILSYETSYQVSLVDPLKTIDKGTFRLSTKGDITSEKISYSRSDTFLTIVLDLVRIIIDIKIVSY